MIFDFASEEDLTPCKASGTALQVRSPEGDPICPECCERVSIDVDPLGVAWIAEHYPEPEDNYDWED